MMRKDAETISHRLANFRKSRERLDEPDMDAVYDRRWVAAHNGEVVAYHETLEGLCIMVDAQNIPRGECQFQFVGGVPGELIFGGLCQ